MAKNDFKTFATGKNANVMSQEEWEELPALLSGFTAGKASSAQVNKVIRQASFIAAALAQFVSDKTQRDVLDNGDLPGFVELLGSGFAVEYLSRKNPFGDIKSDGTVQTALENLGLEEAAKAGITGASAGLKITTTGTSHPITISAREVCLKNSTGMQRTVGNVALTLNLNNIGENGLDTGALAAAKWYAVYVISDGTNLAALGSLSETAPTLPQGYTYAGRVGWVRTDSSANKYPLSMVQVGRSAQYKVASGSNVTNLPIMASGQSTSPVAVSISAFAPPSAGKIKIVAGITSSGFVGFAPSSNYNSTPSTNYLSTAHPNGYPFAGGYNTGSPVPTAIGELVLESTTVYYVSSGVNGVMECMGWEEY